MKYVYRFGGMPQLGIAFNALYIDFDIHNGMQHALNVVGRRIAHLLGTRLVPLAFTNEPRYNVSDIINEQHLISGGQPPEVFARALRQIAANAVNDTQHA